jgi:general secretion pathway protein B
VSLILDALRKADAERERGSVPSLHSQPVAPKSTASPRASAVRPTWLWIGFGAAIGLASAAAWFLLAGNAPPTSVARPPLAQPVPPPVAPTSSIAPVAPASSTATPAAAVAPGDAQAIAAPAPWRTPEERKEARAEAKSGVAAPPAATAAPTESPVVARDQLPPNIRSELPQFAVGGSIYSSNPAARSLIVNGQLYREKDRLTQDLSLEEIKLKSAVFSFRGHRFEVLF